MRLFFVCVRLNLFDRASGLSCSRLVYLAAASQICVFFLRLRLETHRAKPINLAPRAEG